jgi:hypothetical protein
MFGKSLEVLKDVAPGGGPNDNRGDGVWGVTNSPGHAGANL